MDSYSEISPALPSGDTGSPDQVVVWTRTNANYSQRSGLRSAPTSNYASSSFGGSSLRRKRSRRPAQSSSGVTSAYDEEEEGYASGGEYDDSRFELMKIRVKVGERAETKGRS